MRGGGKAKKPENVTQRDNQQMERSEERRGRQLRGGGRPLGNTTTN
jgi:hypothetical protein